LPVNNFCAVVSTARCMQNSPQYASGEITLSRIQADGHRIKSEMKVASVFNHVIYISL